MELNKSGVVLGLTILNAIVWTCVVKVYANHRQILNASNLTNGTVPNARLDSSSVTLQGNAFNGANQLIKLDGSGNFPLAAIIRGSNVVDHSLNGMDMGFNIVVGTHITPSTVFTMSSGTLSGTITVGSITSVGNVTTTSTYYGGNFSALQGQVSSSYVVTQNSLGVQITPTRNVVEIGDANAFGAPGNATDNKDDLVRLSLLQNYTPGTGARSANGGIIFNHNNAITDITEISAIRMVNWSMPTMSFYVANPVATGLLAAHQRMVIRSDGKVGMGFSSPTAMLDIYGGSVTIRRDPTSSTMPALGVIGGTVTAAMFVSTSNAIQLGTPVWHFPPAACGNGQVMKDNGSGVLACADDNAGGGGGDVTLISTFTKTLCFSGDVYVATSAFIANPEGCAWWNVYMDTVVIIDMQAFTLVGSTMGDTSFSIMRATGTLNGASAVSGAATTANSFGNFQPLDASTQTFVKNGFKYGVRITTAAVINHNETLSLWCTQTVSSGPPASQGGVNIRYYKRKQ